MQLANSESSIEPHGAARQRLLRLGARFGSFVVVGGIATGVHYAVLIILHELAGVRPTPATTAGFIVGGIVSYWLNHRFTFAGSAPHGQALPRFFVTALAGLVLNSATVAFLTSVLGVHYLIAQVLATGLCLVWNFLVNHFWSFRGER